MGRTGTKHREEPRYSTYKCVHGRSRYRQPPHRSASMMQPCSWRRAAAQQLETNLGALHRSMCARINHAGDAHQRLSTARLCGGTYRSKPQDSLCWPHATPVAIMRAPCGEKCS